MKRQLNRKIVLTSCSECPYLDHTGAFTKNGAVYRCTHPEARERFKMSLHTGDKKDENWRIARVKRLNIIPFNCPLPKDED